MKNHQITWEIEDKKGNKFDITKIDHGKNEIEYVAFGSSYKSVKECIDNVTNLHIERNNYRYK